jgi:hypothetical protein
VRLVRIHGVRTQVVAKDATLAAAGGTRLAVTSAGALALLQADGSKVADLARGVTSRTTTAAGSTRVAVASSRSLDVYDAASGAKLFSYALGAATGLKLVGVNASLALLRGSGREALVRLSDGKVAQLPSKGVVDARLTEAGLFSAYNTPNARLKGRVAFEPAAALLRRF